jgi:hypothetical protein
MRDETASHRSARSKIPLPANYGEYGGEKYLREKLHPSAAEERINID